MTKNILINTHMILLRALLILGFLFTSSLTFAQKIAVPELWNMHVHDDAKILSQQTVEFLENKLRTFEDSTSNQMVILIVKSLNGEEIEQFGIEAAKKWKLGVKEKDNGVILLISIDDHKVRIEVGHGLEGVLTDALTNRIIRNEIAPAFRKGDYDGGVAAATQAIIAASKGEYKSDGVQSGRKRSGKGGIPIWLIIFLVFGIISLFSKRNGGGRSGGWSSGGGFFMGGGGGSWGGGGGGGGFSGGGGSFGGGGSSGSW